MPSSICGIPFNQTKPNKMSSIYYTEYESPVGTLILSATEDGLSGLWITGEKHAPVVEPSWKREDQRFSEVKHELDDYFVGKLKEFRSPLASAVGTPFQQQVWKALTEIPYGVTISYGELARRINNPAAVRAVGLANGKNPVSIIVPCHRVIGANGSLTGYGGGMAAKKWLLEHETRHTLEGRPYRLQ